MPAKKKAAKKAAKKTAKRAAAKVARKPAEKRATPTRADRRGAAVILAIVRSADPIGADATPDQTIGDLVRARVRKVMAEHDNIVARASKALGVHGHALKEAHLALGMDWTPNPSGNPGYRRPAVPAADTSALKAYAERLGSEMDPALRSALIQAGVLNQEAPAEAADA
jgi:hypothetical protein